MDISSLFDPNSTQSGLLASLLGGQAQGKTSPIQGLLGSLGSYSVPQFPRPPMAMPTGAAPAAQPFAPLIPPAPVPGFSTLAMLRQKLGLPAAAPQPQGTTADPMEALLALGYMGGR